MQTLAQLRSGELKGTKQLSISENLTSFPHEIFELADTLEFLDLSNNLLSHIPSELSRLKKLKIAFFSYNNFTSMPSAFKECENLYMLGLKANQIEHFDEEILPLSISWLILTDNRLKSLPNSIGKLSKLQKFPLAGNQLTYLPDSMAECKNLELLRLSANQLQEIPSWLLTLPKLSWLAFSGNPCVESPETNHKEIAYEEIEVKELLGEGASGKIFKGYMKKLDKDVAIKFFKGAVTSDGYAKDEMNACMSVGEHENLIKVFAKIKGDERLGLLLEYIPAIFENLGLPPNFDTCTRDIYEEGREFSIESIYKIAKAIVSAASHLHNKGLMHGDLYAHNILINNEYKCYLGDFGAASFYDKENRDYEKIEVRAFGCLLDDMLVRCDKKDEQSYKSLDVLRNKCMSEDVQSRPLFEEMVF
ncbi:protein kinase [Candidatus Sulfurimonas marisnigri]|uniref:Protein kinase n=1 Tax=Candidatus Sulfurimonas marisnigri TaxID=2740405 RepID=A0A7S7LYQ2_9BACT|nr:protein kinase [Candidatus Sulfurimonas marisnigri]QOY53897.1 protein kinase [Candidatus Sulfurimonas marisnigri]